MLLGEKIRAARQTRKLTLQQLADFVGVSKSAVFQWEHSDGGGIDIRNLGRLTAALRVPAEYLLNDKTEAIQTRNVPLLTHVSAGKLAETQAVESWDDYPQVTVSGLPKGRYIALKVEGNSMNQVAPDGAVIFVNRDETELESGGDYVIAIADGSATFKRFRANPSRFEPVSSQHGHDIIFPEGPVRVIGRVRRQQSDF